MKVNVNEKVIEQHAHFLFTCNQHTVGTRVVSYLLIINTTKTQQNFKRSVHDRTILLYSKVFDIVHKNFFVIVFSLLFRRVYFFVIIK